MPLVSFVSTCMGRLGHLQRSLPTWLAQSDAEVVVVDYSCPDGSGDWVAGAHPGVKVLRVPGRGHFNLAEARNAGAAVAEGRWLCFIDADILLAPEFAATVFPSLAADAYLLAQGGTVDLLGTVLVPRAAFDAVGGYDEALEGWGNEDGDLYQRLRWAGLRRAGFPHTALESIQHGDAERVAHARVKDRQANWLVNRAYLEAKWNFMKLQQRSLPLDERRQLYDHVRKTVLGGLASGAMPPLEFSLGWGRMIPGVEVEHRFSVRLRPVPTGPDPGAGGPVH